MLGQNNSDKCFQEQKKTLIYKVRTKSQKSINLYFINNF